MLFYGSKKSKNVGKIACRKTERKDARKNLTLLSVAGFSARGETERTKCLMDFSRGKLSMGIAFFRS